MALLKILAAAACVAAAVAVAPKVLNEDGNVLLQVGPAKRVGFQAGSDAATYLDELQLAAESSESLSYLHLGYQNAYKNTADGIAEKVAVEQGKLDAATQEHTDKKLLLANHTAQYAADFGDRIDALRQQLAEAQAGGALKNSVAAVGGVCQSAGSQQGPHPCSTTGSEVMVGVVGEIYPNAGGVFDCVFTWNKLKVTTSGVGMMASASGTLSAVKCTTPVFTESYLTAVGKTKDKDTWKTSLAVTASGVGVPYGGTDPNGNMVEFQTIKPKFLVTDTRIFKAEATALVGTLAKGPTEVTQIMVHDPDSTSASLKFTFQGVDTTHIKKLEAVKVSEADGKVHYSLRATGTGKKATKTMAIKITVTDQNGGTAQQDFALQVLMIEVVGVGGTANVLTPDQTVAVWNKIGVTHPSQLVMCYNSKKHGYDSNTQYKNCAGKGPTFLLARRSNKRVFGGFLDVGLEMSYGWKRGSDGKSFVWNVAPKTKQIEFFLNKGARRDYKYYMHKGMSAYFGPGQALYCDGRLTYCASNMNGDSYNANGRNSNLGQTVLTGSRSWREQKTMLFEVYYVKQ